MFLDTGMCTPYGLGPCVALGVNPQREFTCGSHMSPRKRAFLEMELFYHILRIGASRLQRQSLERFHERGKDGLWFLSFGEISTTRARALTEVLLRPDDTFSCYSMSPIT